MSCIQQSAGLVGPIPFEQRVDHALVANIRQAGDESSGGGQKRSKPPEQSEWVVEMLEDIAADDAIKGVFGKIEFQLFDIPQNDLVQMLPCLLGYIGIQFDPCDVHLLALFENPAQGTGGATDIEKARCGGRNKGQQFRTRMLEVRSIGDCGGHGHVGGA